MTPKEKSDIILDEKYKIMTEQLRLTYSDEDVSDYLRWIITSDMAKNYWKIEVVEYKEVT